MVKIGRSWSKGTTYTYEMKKFWVTKYNMVIIVNVTVLYT